MPTRPAHGPLPPALLGLALLTGCSRDHAPPAHAPRAEPSSPAVAVPPRVISPPPAPFTGAPPVVRNDLELHLQSLDLHRSLSLTDASATSRLILNAYVRASDGGVGFTTRRSLRLVEVRDDHGRDLLALAASAPADPRFRDDPDADDLFPFARPGQLYDKARGYRCFISARLEGIPADTRRIATLRAEARAICPTATKTVDVPLPADDDPARFTLRELTPGLWFSLDVASVRDRTLNFGYRYWLCNDVAPEFAGKPEVGTRRPITDLGAADPPARGQPVARRGHDRRRPPFIQKVEIVDSTGKVLAARDIGTVEVNRPSGVYGEMTDRAWLAAAPTPPLAARVTVITDVGEVVLPIALDNLPLVDDSPPPSRNHPSWFAP